MLLAAAALIVPAATGPARAADMPAKAPAAAYSPYNWSGLYIGLHVGAGRGSKRWLEDGSLGIPGIERSAYDVSGWLGGGQAGYNLQTGRVVIGLELDVSATGIRGSQGLCYVGFGPQSCDSRIDWITTVAGRVGWTFDRALLYAKGGFAWLGEKHNNPFPGFGVWTASETRHGWMLGAGIEYAFSSPWSLKLEYNYFGLGTRNLGFTGPIPGNVFGADIRQRLDVVKVGVNYRFNQIR